MFINQLVFNLLLFISSSLGLIFNHKNFLVTLMCLELLLLSVNLNFITFSVYLDDFYGQIFSMFILSIAASESAIGLAIIILYNRIKGTINYSQFQSLRY